MLKKKRLKFGTLAAALLTLAGGVANAATFQVTQLTDDNGPCDADCSLREAILAANALPGRDLIEVPAGTHVLTIPGIEEFDGFQGDLDIRETVEVRGAPGGATVIQAAMGDRVLFAASSGPTGREVLLTDLTITGGFSNTIGAGIWASSCDLTLQRVEVTGNSSELNGGGIYISEANLYLVDSSVTGNSAAPGIAGGISLVCGAPCTARIERTTISGNTATFAAGAILNGATSLTIVDSTITDNPAPNTIANQFGVERIHFERSIIDGNCNSVLFVTSGGGNLESPGDTCLLTGPTDLVNLAEVGLGPLADNGGPTRTHLPLPGSPAIDAAGLNCDAFDQRGFPRPEDGDFDGIAHCDSGAVEAYSRGLAIDVPSLGLPGGVLLAALLALAGFGVLRRVGG